MSHTVKNSSILLMTWCWLILSPAATLWAQEKVYLPLIEMGTPPGGSKIAFLSDRDGDYEIYMMNADGTEQINLTNNPARDFSLAWSPNGSKIAFNRFKTTTTKSMR